jgi:hypothetical protein
MARVVTVWPDLSYAVWRDTAATLQLWTQIVCKVRVRLTPWVNHGWQVPLYVSARGLGTSPIPIGDEILEIEFDFISHRLVARTSLGEERMLPLEPQSVAEFYCRVIDLLRGIGVAITRRMPSGGRSFRSIVCLSSSAVPRAVAPGRAGLFSPHFAKGVGVSGPWI